MSDLIGLRMADSCRLSTRLLPEALLSAAADFSPTRQASFIAGRALLAAWCYERYGCSLLPEIVTGPHGRPAFMDSDWPDFSISHSGEWLWLAIGHHSLGLDVEQHRPRRNLAKLMAHVLSDLELHWMATQEDELSAFYRLWTLREAVLKASGRGLAGLSRLRLDPEVCLIATDEVAPGHIVTAESEGCAIALYQPQLSLPTTWRWSAHAGFVVNAVSWLTPWQVIPSVI